MKAKTTNFIPRPISSDQAARGYNNEGRGELIGYICAPKDHEENCPYREDVEKAGGNLDAPRRSCACRIGLWQEAKPKKVRKSSVKPLKKSAPKRRSRS